MTPSQKSLLGRSALAVLSIATIVTGILVFIRPHTSPLPATALLALTVAFTALLRNAGLLPSSKSNRRDGPG